MSRGLTTAQSNALTNANAFQAEYLIEIFSGEGTNYFYTTGFSDVTGFTSLGEFPTSISVTYSANNQISVVSPIKESYDPVGNEFTLEWATTDNTIPGILSQNFLKTRIVVGLLWRDPSSNTIVSNSRTLIYSGTATAMEIVGNLSTYTIQLKSQSVFRNLDNVKTRTTTDIEPFGARSITWGTIVWQ